MFQIAICDDEPAVCLQLRQMLTKHPQASQFLISEFASGNALYAFLLDGHAVDLIILDIEMPGINGVELGTHMRERLRDDLTQILYVSGKQGYEKQLFDVQPLNFLEKPVNQKKLLKCIDKAIALSQGDALCFTFTANKIVYRIRMREIRYFENYKRQVIVHTINGDQSFYSRFDDLDLPADFIRIHQAYIVNCRYIRTMQRDQMLLDNGTALPVSRAYSKSVNEILLQAFRSSLVWEE